MKEITITGRLANNEPQFQDYWPQEKRIALAGIIYHWVCGSRCTGKDCEVCKAIEEMKYEPH